MSNEIKRIRYFNGLLLKDDDLALEQDYHIRLNRLHNRYFHNWGIVYGLKVTAVDKAAKVIVSQGMALNNVLVGESEEAQSQEIWICDNHPDNPVNLSGCNINTDIYITVCYEQCNADFDTAKGGDNEIHIWERARINHSLTLPADKSKDIVLARVRLAMDDYDNVYVKEISYEDPNGKPLRTSAIPNAADFEKVTIGKKGDSNLPFMNGLIDDKLAAGKGIEFHSPFTKFSGSLISGALKTEGDVDIKGTLTVTANNKEALKVDSDGRLYASKPVYVKEMLSSEGGLHVSGSKTNIDTTEVMVTSSTLTINNYTPGETETEPRKQNSGIIVYRGNTEPNAKLMWDETDGKWKAGTVSTDGKGMNEIAYGEAWDTLHKGANADLLHRHMMLYDKDGNIGLSVDANGNIDISKSIIASGVILEKDGGIEVKNGDLANARLAWNDTKQKWQIRDGSEMVDLLYGNKWNVLIANQNADALHTHRELYSQAGDVLALQVYDNGSIKATQNLTVDKNLIVEGELTVKGNKSVVNTVNLQVENNVITVNKYPDGVQPTKDGGMEVYRGGVLPNACIIWDEGSNSWKIGTTESMSTIPSGIQWEELTHGGTAENLHRHSSIYSQDGTQALTAVSEGDLEANSNLSVNGELTVEDDAKIKGKMSVDGSLIIEGDLTVNGTKTVVNQKTLEVENNTILVNNYTGQTPPLEQEAGLEVYRGEQADKARIVWNETEKKWKFGTENDMAELPNTEDWESLTEKTSADGLHKHSLLCDKNGVPALNVNVGGDIQLSRDTEVRGELSVDGSVTVLGDLDVGGTITWVKKVDMEVTDNVITLNKFEGDTPKLVESGIEIFRGNPNPKARLIWDESQGKWKIGNGTELKEIICGAEWNTLIKDKNADSLHMHGQLYNEQGNILALSTTAGGNVNVAHTLSVAQNLGVLGNFEVTGGLAAINTEIFEVKGNSIILNKFEAAGDPPVTQSGLKVFRGINNPSAGIIWDEETDSWKVGLIDKETGIIKDNFTIKSDGSLEALGGIKAANAEFAQILTNGSLNAGSITTNNVNIRESLNVQNGMKVVRTQDYDAHVKWEESNEYWNIGTTYKPGMIVKKDGKVGIGKMPQMALDVDGDVQITGKANILGGAVITGNADITGGATIKGGATIEGPTSIVGNLRIKNGNLNGELKAVGNVITGVGIEVDRGKDKDNIDLPAAKFLWDETNKVWNFGFGDNLQALKIPSLENGHCHTRLYNNGNKIIAVDVADDGKVGIGTTLPQSELHVEGDALIAGKTADEAVKLEVKGSILAKDKISAGSAEISGSLIVGKGIEIDRGDNLNAQILWNNLAGKWQAGIENKLFDISLSDHSHQKLFTTGGVEALTIVSEGNIGIGTTAPGAKLEVNGNAIVNGKITAVDANISGSLTLSKGIEVDRGTSPKAQIVWDNANGKWQAGTADKLSYISLSDHSHQNLLTTGGLAALTVDGAGNIGIGTTAPTAKLEVDGNVAVKNKLTALDVDVNGNLKVSGSLAVSSGMEVDRGTKPKAQIVWNETSGKWTAGAGAALSEIEYKGHTHQSLYVGSNEAVKVDENGNIGIGTTAPTAKLEINGDTIVKGKISAVDANLSGSLTLSKGIDVDRGTSPKAQIAWDNANGKWQAGTADKLSYISLSDHSHQNLMTTGGSAALTIDASGNIGIGTTAPTAKLEVNGNAIVKTKLSAADAEFTGSLTVSKGVEVSRGTDTKAQIMWDESTKKWKAGIGTTLSEIEYTGHTHQGLFVGTNQVVTVDTNGNMGIGITAPTAKLEVNGDTIVKGKITAVDANLSGSLTVSAGIEVARGTKPKAQILWNETSGKWTAGTGTTLSEIEYKGHTHQGLYAGSTEAVSVDSNGNVGIGKTPEAGIKLSVDGDIKAATLTQASSSTNTENIVDLTIETATNLLNNLKSVSFDYKAGSSRVHNIGFIAENVPDALRTSDGKSVVLMDIIGVLTTIAKNQCTEINTMKTQITELQTLVAALKNP